MKIRRNNYESIFLDHLEGKLSADEEKELALFLLKNPDLAAELEEVKSSSDFLPADLLANDEYAFKSDLRKNEAIAEAEILLAKDVEEGLDENERKRLNLLMADDEQEFRRNLLRKCVVRPEPETFDNKKGTVFPDKITPHNDELRLIALLENDLTEKERSFLLSELSSSADLQEMNRVISHLKIQAENDVFAHKAKLYADSIAALQAHEELALQKRESGLNAEEETRLQKLGTNSPAIQREIDFISHAKLNPPVVVFERKSDLYKKESRVISFNRKAFYYTSSAAAVLALMVGIIQYEGKSSADNAYAYESNPTVRLSAANADAPANHMTISQSEADRGNKPGSNKPDHKSPRTFSDTDEQWPLSAQNSSSDGQAPKLSDFADLSPISGLPAGSIASNRTNELAYSAPDMQLIHGPSSNPSAPAQIANQPSQDLLGYLGQKALARLEQTYAYTLAARKLEKIEETTKKEVELGVEKESEEKRIHFKLGSFEYSTKRKEQELGFIDRAYGLYKKISGDK